MTTQPEKPNDAWHRYDPNWPILANPSPSRLRQQRQDAYDDWCEDNGEEPDPDWNPDYQEDDASDPNYMRLYGPEP